MAWQITIDASTLSMIGATLMAVGTAVWYVSRGAAKIDSISKLEELVSQLRNEQARDRADWRVIGSKVATMWHRFGFSDREIRAVREEVAGDRPRFVIPLPQAPQSAARPPRTVPAWREPIPRTDDDDDSA